MSREDRRQITSEKVIELCHQLLSSKGEASGIALSYEILDCYQYLPPNEKFLFFNALLSEFSAPQDLAVNAARAFLDSPSVSNLALLSESSEPTRRRLILRLNQADNATLLLIKMREDLLEFIKDNPSLKDVDRDFKKLFTSWFNGGFLNLKRLDWSSSASILEKIIRYEAVHNMSGWDDLRKRLDPPDRHIYGFFHPRLKEEPLIFVEVALTADKPEEIGFILEDERQFLDAEAAKTATFYSISNCQKGLRGIPLGSFLIKQVVEDLRETFPALEEFVTLSPIPGFS
ncbi:MAG: malonyl-CoA decarboxylase family protein, partial [Lentilitoribacter sp.]